VHPSQARNIEWNEGNRQELADPAHPIEEWEVEEVFANGPIWARNRKRRTGDWKMIGRTNGGRRLTIVLEVKPPDTKRPITGWDATKGERTRYDSETAVR
jgi:uncharacterized DUF497 family protein